MAVDLVASIKGLNAVSGIALIYFVFTGILAYQRRNIQPLKVRSQVLMILSSAPLAAIAISKLIVLNTVESCLIYPSESGLVNFNSFFLNGELYNLTFMAIVLREYRLVKIFDFKNFAKINLSKEASIKFLKDISDKRMFKILAIEFFFHALVFSLQAFGSGFAGHIECSSDTKTVTAKIGTALAVGNFIIFSLIIFGYGIVIIRRGSDIFFLRQELIAASFIGLITWPIILALGYTLPDPLTQAITYNFLVIINFIILHFCVVTYPLIQTFLPKPVILSYGPIKNISDVLTQPDLRNIFVRALIQELSIENLLFVDEVNELKNAANDKQAALAHEIMNKYIIEGAELSVNLEQDKEVLQQEMAKGDFKLLYEARDHVMGTLMTDSYPRFLRTPEVKQWLAYKQQFNV